MWACRRPYDEMASIRDPGAFTPIASRSRSAEPALSAGGAEGGLRGRQPGDRHPERRTGARSSPISSQKPIDAGSPPCSPQMPSLMSRRVALPFSWRS